MPPLFIELCGKFYLKLCNAGSILALLATSIPVDNSFSASIQEAGSAFMDLEGLLKNLHYNR